MRILAVHGVSHSDAQTDWQPKWEKAITSGLRAWDRASAPQLRFMKYDNVFEQHDLHAGVVLEAFVRLSASGLFHGLADVFRNRRGLGDSLEAVRWTAGMVAQWVALDGLRRQLRQLLSAEIRKFQPDVVVAHSLGSLIAYDMMRRDEVEHPRDAAMRGRTLVTLGSQIGNATVRATFGGRIAALQQVRFWWHLYNENDDVFTAPIAVPDRTRFRQVKTWFDVPGFADHEGDCYLAHPETGRQVWQDVAAQRPPVRARGTTPAASQADALAPAQIQEAKRSAVETAPQLRALLVGVADYPNPADRLEGPVNDVFNVSATLQELGFPADNIRVVLDERATTAGIRERLRWLLADAKSGDTLFFFFAGHGAQVPAYGQDAEIDHIDECLVPYDFDWDQERAITDDEFAALYSQLPYDCDFVAVLDCCHSGGMTRAGNLKARVITPPDDIRHRTLRWDAAARMWVARERFERDKSGKDARLSDKEDRSAWLGDSGRLQRIGRATSLWSSSEKKFRESTRAHGHRGPYAPVLFEACGEGESAYEYRHGVTSYGAFSYALCEVLRDAARGQRQARSALTFARLLEETTARVRGVVSEPQSPQLVCPATRRAQVVPGTRTATRRRPTGGRRSAK